MNPSRRLRSTELVRPQGRVRCRPVRRAALGRQGPWLGAGVLVLAGCGGQAIIDAQGDTTSTSTTSQGGNTTTTTTTTTTSGTGGSGGTYVPPIDALVEHPFGTLSSGDVVSFQPDADILGMTAVVEAPGDYAEVGFEEVQAPNDTFIVDDFTIEGTAAYYQSYRIMAVAVPQTDHAEAMPILQGPWTFKMYTDYGGGADVSVWTRHTVDGQFHGGVIDVNVFLVASAASETYVSSVLEQAFEPWYGLGLGRVTFHTLSEQYAVIDEYAVFDLFQQTHLAEGLPALNVLVVADFSGELSDAGGFTLGAPGFPLRHGTLLSGVVVRPYGSYDIDSLIVQHETGHLAGLYHTSEFDPGLGDYLDDTPLCDDVWQQMESCPDYDNLMFPTGGDGQVHLTPKQLKVVRGSTLYRAIVQEGDPPVPSLDESYGGQGAHAAPPASAQAGASPAGRRAPRVAPSEQPWAAGVPRRLAAFLAGVWEPGRGAARPSAQAARLAGGDAGLLWALASSDTAPAYVRMRATLALGQLAPSAEQRASLAALALDRHQPRLVRLGALHALALAAAPELARVQGLLQRDADPVVSQVAAAHLR